MATATPDTAQAAPPLPEPQKAPEPVKPAETPLNERQRNDVLQLGKHSIFKSMEAVRAKADAGEALTDREKKVQEHLLSIDQDFPKNSEFSVNGSKGIYAQVKPMRVPVADKPGLFTVVRIDARTTNTSKDGKGQDVFICMVQDANGNITPEEVGYDEFIQGQFISEADDFVDPTIPDAQLSPEDRLLKMYLAAKKGEPLATPFDSATVDRFLAERAKETGAVTHDTIRNFAARILENNVRQQRPNDATPDIMNVVDARMMAIDTLLGEGQIPDATAIMDVLGQLGISPAALGEQAATVQQQLDKLTAQLDRNRNAYGGTEALRNQISALESQLAALNTAIAVLPEQGELQELFEGTQNGTVDAETAQGILDVLNGAQDQQDFLKKILPVIGKRFGWTDDEIQRRADELEKKPGLLGFIIAMILMSGKEVFGEAGQITGVTQQQR